MLRSIVDLLAFRVRGKAGVLGTMEDALIDLRRNKVTYLLLRPTGRPYRGAMVATGAVQSVDTEQEEIRVAEKWPDVGGRMRTPEMERVRNLGGKLETRPGEAAVPPDVLSGGDTPAPATDRAPDADVGPGGIPRDLPGVAAAPNADLPLGGELRMEIGVPIGPGGDIAAAASAANRAAEQGVMREQSQMPHPESIKKLLRFQVLAQGGVAGPVNDILVDDSDWMLRRVVITLSPSGKHVSLPFGELHAFDPARHTCTVDRTLDELQVASDRVA